MLVITLRVVTFAERAPNVLAFETNEFEVVVALRYGTVNVSYKKTVLAAFETKAPGTTRFGTLPVTV